MPNYARLMESLEDLSLLAREIRVPNVGRDSAALSEVQAARLAGSGENLFPRPQPVVGQPAPQFPLPLRSEIFVPGLDLDGTATLGTRGLRSPSLKLEPAEDYPRMPPEIIDWDKSRRKPPADDGRRPGLHIPAPDYRRPPPDYEHPTQEDPRDGDGEITVPLTRQAMNGDGPTMFAPSRATVDVPALLRSDVSDEKFGQHVVMENDPANGYLKVKILEPPATNNEQIEAGSIYEVFNNGNKETKHGYVHSIETQPSGEIVYRNKDRSNPDKQFVAWDYARGTEQERMIGDHRATFVSSKVFADGRTLFTEADGSVLLQGGDGGAETFKPVGAFQLGQQQKVSSFGAIYRRADSNVVYMDTMNRKTTVAPTENGSSLLVSSEGQRPFSVNQIRETYQGQFGFRGFPIGFDAATDVYFTPEHTRYRLTRTVMDVLVQPRQEPFGTVVRTINDMGASAFRDPRHVLLTDDGSYLSYIQFGKLRTDLDTPFEPNPRLLDGARIRGYWEFGNGMKKMDPW